MFDMFIICLKYFLFSLVISSMALLFRNTFLNFPLFGEFSSYIIIIDFLKYNDLEVREHTLYNCSPLKFIETVLHWLKRLNKLWYFQRME